MPAIDSCEPQVIRALEKEGWRLYRKPHEIVLPTTTLYADFSITRQEQEILIIEVKCFPKSASHRQEMYRAIGQYSSYRFSLEVEKTDLPLYLAVPDFVYDTLLQTEEFQLLLTGLAVKLMVYDLEAEVVKQWIV